MTGHSSSFEVQRSRAIEVYAMLEQSLCNLFSTLLGADAGCAGIVFYRITNATARNAILEALVARRYAGTYEHYLNGVPNTPNRRGLMTLLRRLDQRRNEIVHWHTVHDNSGTALMRPNAWSLPADIETIKVDDLRDFCQLGEFVHRSVMMFNLLVAGKLDKSQAEDTWRSVCSKPCVYPPPQRHPLADRCATLSS